MLNVLFPASFGPSTFDQFSREVDRLLYWSSEVTTDKAKVVSMVSGSAGDKPLSDPAPRAFCVSRR